MSFQAGPRPGSRNSDAAWRHIWRANQALDLADAAFTLQTGRRAFDYRQAFTCSDHDGARKALSAAPVKTKAPRSAAAFDGVAFMFPGQGAQYVDMGRSIYDEEPLFRREVDEACEVLAPFLGRDLRQIIYPAADRAPAAAQELKQTCFTQPALFVVEHALARLWMSWGVQPAASIGHSLGEYVSATIAGTFDRDAALTLVAKRAALTQALPSGSMLAVKAQPARLAGLLTEGVCLAAYNTPGMVVVAGAHDAIDQFERELSATRSPIVGSKLRTRSIRPRWMRSLSRFSRSFARPVPKHPASLGYPASPAR